MSETLLTNKKGCPELVGMVRPALKAKAGRKSRNTGCQSSDQITANLLKHHWVPSIFKYAELNSLSRLSLKIAVLHKAETRLY